MTTRLRYAVMFMVGLAQGGGLDSRKPKRASVIAEGQSLSEGYLEKVIPSLKSRGLIRSVRGPGGGYALNMPPDRITLDMLLDSVGDKVKMVRCEGEHRGCLSSSDTTRCNSHSLWHGMERYMMHYLSNTSILDVCNDTLKVIETDGDLIYADHNATSEIGTVVRRKLADALLAGNFYNPSSVHKPGQKARKIVEDARSAVVRELDAYGYGVIFTSSGTEANNLVFSSLKCKHIVSAVEHPSVLNAAVNPTIVPVDINGVVCLEELEQILISLNGESALLSVMLANNETGVIQPLESVVSLARRYGVRVHVDAVQACGKIPFSVSRAGWDFVTISAHKIGGLPGSGVLLYNKKGVDIVPMMVGGLQEGGLRAGTENVLAIYSLFLALEGIEDRIRDMKNVESVRDFLEEGVKKKIPKCTILGDGARRLPNTTCVSIPGVSAETQLIALDNVGIAVGIGSACSTGKINKSNVLSAMKVGDESAKNAIRISLGPGATMDQASRIVDSLHSIYCTFCGLS